MDQTITTLGGTTISASISDSQTQLIQALGSNHSFDSNCISQFMAVYKSSGSGPVLKMLGYNPFEIFATGGFKIMYWGFITILLGIICVIALQKTISARTSSVARHPLGSIATIYFRLLVGVFIIVNTPLLYAMLMTINLVLSQGVQSIASNSMSGLIQSSNLGTLTFAEARIESIRNAATRRMIALYPNDITKSDMIEIGNFYNALVRSLESESNSTNIKLSLPLISSTVLDASTSDAQAVAYIGRTVLQNFPTLIAGLSAINTDQKTINVAYPTGSNTQLLLLSAALANDDALAIQAIRSPYEGSSSSNFEASRQTYSKAVFTDTLIYLDTVILPFIRTSPTLAQKISNWFSERVEQAAAVATGLINQWRTFIDWVARAIGIILTRILSFIFTLGIAALIEIELFVLVLAVPFWLLPNTEEAFYGVLRSLASLSVAVPAYQFIMLFVDSLMGLVLKYILMGSAASSGTGVLGNLGGTVYTGSLLLGTLGTGGELIVLVMACYLVAYLFLAIYIAIKTPRLIAGFIKGTGVAGMFLSTFATGLIAGVASTFATATVAGGPSSLASRLSTRSANIFRSGTRYTSNKASLRKVSSVHLQKAENSNTNSQNDSAANTNIQNLSLNKSSRFNYKVAATFGLRTFMDNLGSETPLDSISSSLKAVELHNKQINKESSIKTKSK